MDTFLAITSRRDERQYVPKALADDLVDRILDAGRLAGSARNRQPWTFRIPVSSGAIEQLSRAVSVPANVLGAGLVVAISVTGSGSALFDAGRAAQNMLLAAWNEGVASCPNGVVDQTAARAAAGITDDGDQLAIVLSFGLPERVRDVDARSAAEWSERANRRPLADVVTRIGL